MNDNKDITEFEEREEMKNWDDIEQDFIIDISRSLVGQDIIGKCLEFISRAGIEPCTLNDRKFLDEVKEKAEYINNMGCIIIPKLDVNSNEHTGFLFQSDFAANLSELMEKKDE
jgi:hypothetical protein